MATINEMRQVATQIENETQVGGNTASRVGGLFNDIVDELERRSTEIDGNETVIKTRRNTSTGFASENPILADGELGFETDRKRYKMGDGVTAWNNLPYRSEELDETPTPNSTRGVESGGVYDFFTDTGVIVNENIPVYSTTSAYRLRSNGTAAPNSAYVLKKYAVTPDDELILNLSKDDSYSDSAVFQFQSAASVPASGTNANLVGTPYTSAFNGAVSVPSGARYLIVSQGVGNTTNLVQHKINQIEPIKQQVEKLSNRTVLLRNNSKDYGIYIDGNSIKMTTYGFAIIINNNIYYIAPQDNSTIYTFTKNANNCYLVIDTSQLGNAGARTEPTCMSVIGLNAYDETKHVIVAVYFTTYWQFFGSFEYFNQNPIQPVCNVAFGGLKIVGTKVVVSPNGYAVKRNGTTYYIAPTDLETITEFTNVVDGVARDSCALVLNMSSLTGGVRTNPSSCMYVRNYSASDRSATNEFIVALWYKGLWKFVNEFSYFEDLFVDKPPFNPQAFGYNIGAHRGTTTYPTNTKESIQDACEKGFKYIECDIRMTSDDVPILMHNATVDFMTNGSGTVSEMTWAQISQLYVDAWDETGQPYSGNDIHVARLVDVLPIIKQYNAILELDLAGRDIDIYQKCYEICEKFGVLNNIVATTFNPTTVYSTGLTNWGVSVAFSGTVTLAALQSLDYDLLKKYPYANISINKEYVTNAMCEYVHQQNVKVKTWTITQDAEIPTYLNMGVDVILGNFEQNPNV